MNPDKKIGIIVCPGHDDGLLALKIAEMKMQDKVEVVTIDEARGRGLTIGHFDELKPLAPIIPDLIAQNYVYGIAGQSSRAQRRKLERESKKNKNNNPFSV